MSTTRHIIRRNTIELRMSRSMDHEAIHDRVAALWRKHLVPLIAEIMDRTTAGQPNLRIERLELDLGRISMAYLDEEMIGKLAESLEAALLSHLAEASQDSEVNLAGPGGDLELLHYFLETGALPWWADSGSAMSLDTALERLAAERPGELARMLRQTVQGGQRLRRLVMSLPDHGLLRICGKVFPAISTSVVQLLPLLRESLHRIGPAGSGGLLELRQALWRAVFSAEMRQAGGEMEALAQAMLASAAAVMKDTPEKLAGKCLAAASIMPENVPPPVAQILEKIAQRGTESIPPGLRRARAASELASILAEPGMSLERLAAIAPVLRELYHHLDPHSPGSGRLRGLLQTLSKFISPFLDPENQAAAAKNIHMETAAGYEHLSEGAVAENPAKKTPKRPVNPPSPGAKTAEGVDAEALMAALRHYPVSADQPGYDPVQIATLGRDMERSLLKVQAILRELLLELKQTAKNAPALPVDPEKQADPLAEMEELCRSLEAGKVGEVIENEEDGARNYTLEIRNARRLQQILRNWQARRLTRRGQDSVVLLQLSLENLVEQEGAQVSFYGNPGPVRVLLGECKSLKSRAAAEAVSGLEAWLREVKKGNGKISKGDFEEIMRLLRQAEQEATGTSGAGDLSSEDLGQQTARNLEEWAVVLAKEIAEKSSGNSSGKKLRIAAGKLHLLMEVLRLEAGKQAGLRSLGRRQGYAQAVLSFLARAGKQGEVSAEMRRKLLDLSSLLAETGRTMEEEAGQGKETHPQGVASRGPFARGSMASPGSQGKALKTWLQALQGEIGEHWRAAELVLPEEARPAFARLRTWWIRDLKSALAAEILGDAPGWKERIGGVVAAAQRLALSLPERDGQGDSARGQEAEWTALGEKLSELTGKAKASPPEKDGPKPVLPSHGEPVGEQLAAALGLLRAIETGLRSEPPSAEETGQAPAWNSQQEPAAEPGKKKRPRRLWKKTRNLPAPEDHPASESAVPPSQAATLAALLQSLRRLESRLQELQPDEDSAMDGPAQAHPFVLPDAAAEAHQRETHQKSAHQGPKTTDPRQAAAETAQHESHPVQEALRLAALREIAALLQTALPAQLRASLVQLRRVLQPGTPAEAQSRSIRALDEIRQGLDHLRSVLNRELAEGGDQPSPFTDSDALYVGNAGLVLLWPFLARFFEKLGLMQERQFVSQPARQRAVLLLQHLATGHTEFPEYHLPLCKLLCGYPLHQPLPTEMDLDEATAAECAALLEVVPAHNPKMHNLSAEGFRSAWLQREGVLKTRDDNYVLHVERKPYDILLDHLPWTANMLRMQWMEGVLLVEW